MQYDYSRSKTEDSRFEDSPLNESLSSQRARNRKTLDDYDFVLNENSKYKTSDLGKGSYGTVKKVRDKENGKLYAMKIMNKKSIFEFSTKENLKREITIQKKASHPHIIKLLTYFEDRENVYLILEYAENGSLFHYLRKKRKFEETEAFVYFFQTCLGIDYLHKNNIIHRDLKPENLLLDAETSIKLCDFGWSAESYSKRHTFCGTIDYMAPEMVKNHPYDHRIDIWCLGVLLYEMLHGDAPFQGKSDLEKTRNISMNARIKFDSSLSSDAVDLIKKILKPVPADRISMQEIFNHPWMRRHEKIHNININSFVNQNGQNNNQQVQQESRDYQSGAQTKITRIMTIVDDGPPIDLPKQSPKYDQPKTNAYKIETKTKDYKYRSQTEDVDIEQFLRSYGINNTEEIGLLNKVEKLANSGKKMSDDQSQQNDPCPTPKFKKRDASESRFQFPILNPDDSSNDHSNQKKDKKNRAYSQEPSLRQDVSNQKFSPQKNASNHKIQSGKPDQGCFNSQTTIGSDKSQKSGSKNHQTFGSDDDDDIGKPRMSRISKKNIEIGRGNSNKPEPSFFDRILVGLGCISRDAKKP